MRNLRTILFGCKPSLISTVDLDRINRKFDDVYDKINKLTRLKEKEIRLMINTEALIEQVNRNGRVNGSTKDLINTINGQVNFLRAELKKFNGMTEAIAKAQAEIDALTAQLEGQTSDLEVVVDENQPKGSLGGV
jgi:septation ring formation regulator EzrA